MQGIIIYKSKYGATRQYAEWLQSETGFELYDVKNCPADLSRYEIVCLVLALWPVDYASPVGFVIAGPHCVESKFIC